MLFEYFITVLRMFANEIILYVHFDLNSYHFRIVQNWLNKKILNQLVLLKKKSIPNFMQFIDFFLHFFTS